MSCVIIFHDFLSLRNLHILLSLFASFYGMLDQLVASKGRVFVGTWWSTLSGYVNRMRGYYISKHKLDGYLDGTMPSYYFFPVSTTNLLLRKTHILDITPFPISPRCLPVYILLLFVPKDDKSTQMQKYQPVKKPIYMREFPTSWRDIDKGIDEIHQTPGR